MAGIPVVIVGELTYQGLTVGGGPMPGGPHPSHPIAPGGPPPQIWPPGPGIDYPTHPIVIPPGFIDGVHPEHPIVIPPPPKPPTVWPPGSGIDMPSHPIVIPPDLGIWGPTDPRPTNPIVIPPPVTIWPPGSGIDMPTHPIAPGGPPPTPTHPIVIPPDGPPEVMENWEVKAYWTEEGGWGVAIVPSGDQPVPTPSTT